MQDTSIRAAATATASTMATKTTYAGSITTVGGWVISSEVIALCGLALALLGFIVNVVFKVREDRRQAEENRRKDEAHKLAMASLKENGPELKQFLDGLPEILKAGKTAQGYGGMPKVPATPEPTDDQANKPKD